MLILDEQSTFRELLQNRLRDVLPELEVFGGEPGPDPVDYCREIGPDILIFDPGFSGVPLPQVVRGVQEALPAARILIISHGGAAAVEEVIEAVRLGVHGCVLKTEPFEELRLGIEVVARGGHYLSPKIKAALQNPGSSALRSLSSRQREVLRMIAQGLSTKEISSALNLSVKTAGHHRLRLMKKLELHDSVSVVRFAVTTGLVRF